MTIFSRSFLGSSSLKVMLRSVTLTAVLSILLMWLISSAVLKELRNKEKQALLQEVEWIQELYEEEGARHVLKTLTNENERILDVDEIFHLYETNSVFFQLRNSMGAVIAGYPLLEADLGWSLHQVEQKALTRPLLQYAVEADNGFTLTVAKFRDNSFSIVKRVRVLFTIGCLAVIIPISITLGYLLSRRLYQRIISMSDIAEKVGEGETERRIPVKKSQDELDRLSLNINQMLDYLHGLQRNIDSVSIGIAHDLKTPVTHLSGRLQLIRQDIDDKAAVERHIDAADRNINKILTTFNALLRLGEIEAGKRRHDFSVFNLSDLTQDIAESYEPVFIDSGRTLDISIVKSIDVLGDEDLFSQLIVNLLENIIEHSKPNANAWIRLQGSKDGATLQIGDDGPGIPPQHHARIFERFYRVDNSRNKGGNGLGLSLVKSIADLHDAELVLLDNQGGTVFDLYISVTPAILATK